MDNFNWVDGLAKFLDDEQLNLLLAYDGGKEDVMFYLELICYAKRLDHDGELVLDNWQHITEKDLSLKFHIPLNKVHDTLMAFDAFGLVDRSEDRITILCLHKSADRDASEYRTNKAKH